MLNESFVGSDPYEPLDDDATVYDPTTASTTTFFSSYALLNDPAKANATRTLNPVPMGFLVSPSVNLKPEPPRVPHRRAPLRCKGCRAYLNLYNPTVASPVETPATPSTHHSKPSNTGVGTTPLTPTHHHASSSSASTPLGSSENSNPHIVNIQSNTQPQSSQSSGTSTPMARSSGKRNGTWKCVFCGMVHEFCYDESLVGDGFPELKLQVVEYVTHEPDPATSPTSIPRSFVFVIDGNCAGETYEDLQKSLGSLFESLRTQKDARIGLIVFTDTVTVYHIDTNATVAKAHVMSGSEFPSEDDIAYLGLQDSYLFARPHTDVSAPPDGGKSSTIMARADECSDVMLGILKSLESIATARRGHSSRKLSEKGPRALGVALVLALSMLKQVHAADGHGDVIVCTAGAPNIGRGSVNTEDRKAPMNQEASKFYTKLGTLAQRRQCTINVCCGGFSRFGVPVLASLVKASGGHVLLYKDFKDEFRDDMHRCLLETTGWEGELETFSPSSLRYIRVIGGLSEERTRHSDPDARDHEDVDHHTFLLSSLQPHETIAFYFKLFDFHPGSYFYFQFAASWTNRHNQRIVRVCTFRIRTTNDPNVYMRSIDANVVGALIGKIAVLKAVLMDEDAKANTSARAYIDRAVMDLYHGFGSLVDLGEGQRGRTLEEHLAILPLMLYLLRQGPILGPLLQNHDDLSSVRTLFLHASLQDSVRFMLPNLFSFNSIGNLEELPLSNLALQSNRILCLDHQTHVFIWSGSDVTGDEYDSYRDACFQRSKANSSKRFPRPRILMFNETSSDERWLRCRLIPCHNDSIFQQNEDFPQLESLEPHVRSRLLEKFIKTDEPSYRQYLFCIFNKQS